ncbi:chemosensory pili system protein ChpA (sensor histidine kinase/response regulator) [Thiohalospira halophila DSM 15071]|uniref:Chemotaxis protein CheA n=1 Tax=Thiohalospira halophila DSM 15071 TaxID=1123397 RepID=A0A1I1SL01_9GAMM|nr:Hpt domain-containing protein [Thiohalospira halophila]SFD45358.1 chemosensory pili system protein ChpA (sensor histidine kinase/response regulator) [Thiohalospira halophila DSM 15071]
MSGETLRAAETGLQAQLAAEFGELQESLAAWTAGEEEAPPDLDRRLETVAGVAEFGGAHRAALIARGLADAWRLLPAGSEPGSEALPGAVVEDLAAASLGLVAESARIRPLVPGDEDRARLRQALQALMVRWLKGEARARRRLPDLLVRVAAAEPPETAHRHLFQLAAEAAATQALEPPLLGRLERYLGQRLQGVAGTPPLDLLAAVLARISPRSTESVSPAREVRTLLERELTALREGLEAYHAGGGDWATIIAPLPRIAATFQLRGAPELGRRLRQEGASDPPALANLLVAAEQVLAGSEEGEALAAVDGESREPVSGGGKAPLTQLAEEGVAVAADAGEALATEAEADAAELAALGAGLRLPGWEAESEAAAILARAAGAVLTEEARAAAAEVAAWLEAALLARAAGEAADPAAGRRYVAALAPMLPAAPETTPELEESDAAVEPDPVGDGPAGSDGTGPDPELAAIFREEFTGIITQLEEQLAAWERDLHDGRALSEVRRAFHTLKGSGRVAGVESVAEFAWYFEDLLNRLLSGKQEVAPVHRSLVAAATSHLPAAMARVERGEAELDEALCDLMERARRAAEGEVVTAPGEGEGTASAAPDRDIDSESESESESEEAPPSPPEVGAAAGVEPSVDEELVATFRRELVGHLETLRGAARRLREDPADPAPIPELERGLHTLRGNARLVGLVAVATFLQQLEPVVAEYRGQEAPPGLPPLLEETARRVEESARTLPHPDPELAGIESLEARLAELALPASTAPDPELVAVFLEEGEEQLEALAREVRALEQDPAGEVDYGALQRTLHTLKGSARTAGADGVGELAHAAETLTGALDRGEIPQAEAGGPHLRAVIGRFEAMFAALQQGENPAAPDLVDRTQRLAGGEVAAAVRDDAGHGTGGAGDAGQRVRLPAAELERLSAAASEVGAQGARLRQHLGRWRGGLEEVDRVIERVREQIRRLDMETEAQIQARREELGSASSDFDPLEMDRFSNLQTLSRGLGESLSDLEALRASLGEALRHAEADETRQRRAEQSVREGLARARVVPFSSRVPQLRHLVQRQATAGERQVELSVAGGDLALDRSLLGRLVGPLEHLLRNAVIHGIEAPEARLAAGKAETGRIDLAISREGSELRLTVSDDGAGLDPEAVAEAARERGEIGPDEAVTPARAARLILESGLTTRQNLDQDAGRGVGLDAVNSEVKQLGGSLEVTSTPGTGTRFRLRLSLDIALQRVLFLRAGDHVYAVPMADVGGVGQLPAERVAQAEAAGQGLDWSGERRILRHLDDLVGLPRPQSPGERVTLVRVEDDPPLAVVAEALEGQGEVVVRAGGPQVAALPGVTGATVLDDGRVAPLLDLRELEAVPREAARDVRPLALVVDDSITVRRVTGRLLDRHGWRVASARDGVEALEAVEEEPPAVVLLDIEMPRMDGFELLGRLRERADGGPPVVMITSRSGDKHRQRAEALGVSAYLGKPWQEEELLTTLAEAAHGDD